MPNQLTLNAPFISVGIPTSAIINVPTAPAIYNAAVQMTDLPPSGIIASVLVGSSTVYSSSALAAGTPGAYNAATQSQALQSALQFKVNFLVPSTANTVALTFTSSSANDKLLNSVKTSMSVGQGM